MHYLLRYQTAPDYLARRPAFREEHLKLARAAVARGDLLLAGAVGEPITGAVLLFDADSPAAAGAFAARRSYVLNGLVATWDVVPWHTVVGRLVPPV